MKTQKTQKTETETEPINWDLALTGDRPIWRPTRRRGKRNGQYLRGPIPLTWLQAACAAHAVELSVYLWYKAGILGKGALIALRHSELAAFGISRFAVRRQYKALALAGLVDPTLEQGKCVSVRISHGYERTKPADL